MTKFPRCFALLVLLAESSPHVSAFAVNAPTPTSQRQSSVAGGAAATTTALWDSRQRQKVATRTKWLENRGAPSGGSTAPAALKTNADGVEYIQLVHPDTGATADVYPYGGVVTSYVVDGVDYIAVRPGKTMCLSILLSE
jgi:hypothetical protein